MKHESIENLVKKSIVTTSEDFTDKVLLEIELRKLRSVSSALSLKAFLYVGLIVVVGVVVFCIAVLSGSSQQLGQAHHPILFTKTFFLLTILVGLLIGINHVLKLHFEIKKFEDHWDQV